MSLPEPAPVPANQPTPARSTILSKEELEWLQKNFNQVAEQQGKQTNLLRSINTAIQLIGVIILLAAILVGCNIIFSL